MSKQVITVDGQDEVVREDTAKSFRGVHWAFLSLAAFIVILAVLFLGGFLKLAYDGNLDRSPADAEPTSGR